MPWKATVEPKGVGNHIAFIPGEKPSIAKPYGTDTQYLYSWEGWPYKQNPSDAEWRTDPDAACPMITDTAAKVMLALYAAGVKVVIDPPVKVIFRQVKDEKMED